MTKIKSLDPLFDSICLQVSVVSPQFVIKDHRNQNIIIFKKPITLKWLSNPFIFAVFGPDD